MRIESIVKKMEMSCLANKVRKLNRSITAIYDEEFRDLGLKTSQVNVMAAIAFLGECTPRQVSISLNLEKSTVSRNVDKLSTAGWVEVIRTSSGRAEKYQLSEEGRGYFQQIYPCWKRAQVRAATFLQKNKLQVEGGSSGV